MSDSQVWKYAEYLGVDLKLYPELYELMESGLKCPLPDGWQLVRDGATEQHFFVNSATQQQQADHPMDDIFRERAKRRMSELGPRNGSMPRTAPTYMSPPGSPLGLSQQRLAPVPIGNLFRSTGPWTKAKRFRYYVYLFLVCLTVQLIVALGVYRLSFFDIVDRNASTTEEPAADDAAAPTPAAKQAPAKAVEEVKPAEEEGWF